jgi:hypothetical protein
MGWKKFWIFLIFGLLLLAIGLYLGEYVHLQEIEAARATGGIPYIAIFILVVQFLQVYY